MWKPIAVPKDERQPMLISQGPLRNRRMPAGHCSFSVCSRADSRGTLRYIGRLERFPAELNRGFPIVCE